MTPEEFEGILDKVVVQLTQEVRADSQYHGPNNFELRVRAVLESVAHGQNIKINPTFHVHAFPDIRANGFGVEVKTTNKDSWQSVGNSVFEGMRDASVKLIYVVFGKMGGFPEVRWGRYEEIITHVRISHAPRFVLEMDRDSPLFKKMDISYGKFSELSPTDKMTHIRLYSRGRLKPGERLWWLEDEDDVGRPTEITLYMHLPTEEKIKLRAEGVILCPQIVGGSRQKDKYNDIAFFFLQDRNVLCPQTRDLYSAGSVAGKARGGNYIKRSLTNIQEEIAKAALDIEDDLIIKYWGMSVKPTERIKEWLKRADGFAKDWKPSDSLFTG